MTTILLVDDHGLVRRAFRRMIDDELDLRVIGEVGDGHEAIEAVQRLRPNVVVMDFSLPGMNGGVATQRILDVAPNTSVLILSMYSEISCVNICLEAGARGYVLKSATDLNLGEAVRSVAAGKQVLDPQIVLPARLSDESLRALTIREIQVLQLLAEGKSNAEIGKRLSITTRTVGAHRLRIMNAVGIHNSAKLILYAVSKGLVNIA